MVDRPLNLLEEFKVGATSGGDEKSEDVALFVLTLVSAGGADISPVSSSTRGPAHVVASLAIHFSWNRVRV